MGGHDVLSSVVSSQVDLHARFGGVVPEIAGRAHLELIMPVVARAIVESGIDDARIDAVAATVGPGLIGSLLVGVAAAKALALTWDVPFVGVNHLEAHLYAALLEDPTLELPLVVLLVSGGHTMLVEHGAPWRVPAARPDHRRRRRRGLRQGGPLPRARLPGRPGHRPGGHATATRRRSPSPAPMLHDGLDVSFSGLKTAVVNHVRKHPEVTTADVAASFQQAVVDVLVTKARRAARQVGAKGAGARRGRCRQLAAAGAAARGVRRTTACAASSPAEPMCTDNAAMIAAAGWHRLPLRRPLPARPPASTPTSAARRLTGSSRSAAPARSRAGLALPLGAVRRSDWSR